MKDVGEAGPKAPTSHHHRLTSIDAVARTATCSICGPTRILSKCRNYTTWRCRTAFNKRRSRSGYRQHLKDRCQQCGFKGHPCQLDINHINGDHTDDSEDNLETLCANCHRLVSRSQRLSRSAKRANQ